MVRGLSGYSTYCLVAAGVFLAAIGSFYRYSYWSDELYSVVAANLEMRDMFEIVVLDDVHPPLYQVILNLWDKLFGSDERVTRLLSFIFALSSLAIVWCWAKKELGGLGFKTTVIFFSTCPLFAFYAQETRPYAMMLFLSSIVTIAFFQGWHKNGLARFFSFILVSVALTLTHYFGFVYAGLVLIFALYDVRKDIKKSLLIVFSGLACFAWPLVHFVKGEVGEKSGGNFWITSEGVQSTVFQLSSGVTPQINIVSEFISAGYEEYAVALLFTLLIVGVALLAKRGVSVASPEDKSGVWVKCLSLLVVFTIIIAIIDQHSPISTSRNYIVVLPVFSVFLGLAAQGAKSSGFKYAFSLIIVGGVMNLALTHVSVSSKYSPSQNYIEAVRFIEENSSPNDMVYYLSIETSIPEVQEMRAEFYFSEDDPGLIPVAYEDVVELKPPFYVLVQHKKYDLEVVIDDFKDLGLKVDYFSPEKNKSIAVLYSK